MTNEVTSAAPRTNIAPAVAELKTELERVEAVRALFTRDRNIAADSVAEVARLEATIDLSNDKEVCRLASLRTVASVAPERIALRADERKQAETKLRDLCLTFLSRSLKPRLSELEAVALQRVEAKLSDHFPDKDALRHAAYGTQLLKTFAEIQQDARLSDYSVDSSPRFAKLFLELARRADDFEKSLT